MMGCVEVTMITAQNATNDNDVWPALSQSAWSDTCATLQLWLQMVGKVRMALTPAINHCWNVTLYPTIDFDFVEHELVFETSDGRREAIKLEPMTVAEFYSRLMTALESLDALCNMWPVPCEVAQPIPFKKDEVHKAYDPVYAQRFWRILLQSTRVIEVFRARFIGKVSPIHLFWGAMDLACTRFSGRTAPEHPSMPGLPDRVVRDAYSHEVSSCGFWPGAAGAPGAGFIEPFFYSYAYPEPPGYREYAIAPAQAKFDSTFGEFIFPYEAMRQSADPDDALLEFLQSTYEAAANCAKWDRGALEKP
jgi:hypothetical protein